MVFVFSYQFSMNKIQLKHFLVSNARLQKTQYGFLSYSLELDMLGLAGPVVAGHVGVILTVAL